MSANFLVCDCKGTTKKGHMQTIRELFSKIIASLAFKLLLKDRKTYRIVAYIKKKQYLCSTFCAALFV